jgi:3-phosphoshikimate 1-carboxyvinyltransferase
MRLLIGILAGGSIETVLTGDSSLSQRPMRRVADPLKLMGGLVELSPAGTPPVRVIGRPLHGVAYELPVASSQVKTAVLLAGVQADGTTTVREPALTRDHTERMLALFGAAPERDRGGLTVKRTELFSDKEINIPGDFSSASFLLTAAAVVEEGDVTVRGCGVNPTRTPYLNVLRSFGASVEVTNETVVSGEPRADVRVRAGDRRPPQLAPGDVAACIDELPLVAVLGALAAGETEVRGAAELRVKESDRIDALVAGLRGMGADIRALPDGFAVRGPAVLAGGRLDSFGDHRIAMALAVAALTARGETVIEGSQSAAVSYPEFAADLESITGA